MEKYGSYFLLLLLAGALILTFFIFQPFLAPLIMAAVFAVVLQPGYHRVRYLMPRWPSVAAFVTVVITLICILVPLTFIGTQIGLEAADLYTSLISGDAKRELATVLQTVENSVATVYPPARGMSTELTADISQYGELALTWLLQYVGSAFAGIASLFASMFVFFIALYYLLRDGAKVKDTLIELSPLRDSYDETVARKLELAVNSVIKGNLSIALIQGVLSAIGFTIFGVPHSILWGTVAAIASLIPALGTGLVFAPIIIFQLITGNIVGAIGLAIWGAVAVGLIDNLLGPRLIGSGIKLHPLLVLLSVLGGITLFGAIGIFIGPLALSLLFALLSIYSEIARRSA